MNDKVNSPKHYTSHPSGIECIQITEHYNFCIGNAMKYIWRLGLKEEQGYDAVEKQIEDAKKAIWYINRHIDRLQKGLPDPNIKTSLLNWPADSVYSFIPDKEMVARAGTAKQPQNSWLDCND